MRSRAKASEKASREGRAAAWGLFHYTGGESIVASAGLRQWGDARMHEKRNLILILLAVATFIWAFVAWFLLDADAPLRFAQAIFATFCFAALAVWTVYALNFEDKLEDQMRKTVGEVYYDADGLSFLPMIRVRDAQAELSVYYQNRYENPVECVVHLRPPADSFIIKPGVRDVHIAFKASGGDFGVIHQPIAVPRHLQGEVLSVELAAASWYPRSHGSRLIRSGGMACGSMLVDWGGNPLKIGVHEVSGEMKLSNPVTLHMAMPGDVKDHTTGNETWTQERLRAGDVS